MEPSVLHPWQGAQDDPRTLVGIRPLKHPADEWTDVTANPAGALRGTPNSEKYPIQKACVTALRGYHSERKHRSEWFDDGPVRALDLGDNTIDDCR